MRSLRWAVFVFAVAVPLGSAAAPLPFTATLRIVIGIYGTESPTVTGGGIATVNGSGGPGPLTALALPAGAVATTGASTVLDDPPNSGFQLTVELAAGSFAETGGGGFGGVLPLFGVAKVCAFAPCSATPLANLSIPLSVIGQGGTVYLPGPFHYTVMGAPWTTGTTTIHPAGATQSGEPIPLTVMGFRQGPLGATGSTAQPGGTLQLVTPIFLHQGFEGILPSYAELTITFVPEPATVVLLGGGIALLAGLGARRRAGTG